MSAQRLLEAVDEFHKAYGPHPKFAKVVGRLVDAVQGLRVDNTSPGAAAVLGLAPKQKYMQYREQTFNHAGQEPHAPSEAFGKVQKAKQGGKK